MAPTPEERLASLETKTDDLIKRFEKHDGKDDTSFATLNEKVDTNFSTLNESVHKIEVSVASDGVKKEDLEKIQDSLQSIRKTFAYLLGFAALAGAAAVKLAPLVFKLITGGKM